METQFLDLRAAAAHIHMDALELKHFAQRGEVPARARANGTFVFEHRLLDEWAQRRVMELPERSLSAAHREEVVERRRTHVGDIHVADLIMPTGVSVALTARNRGGVIRDMTDLANATGLVYDPETLFAELTAREEAASTAVGGGAAFLHPKYNDPYLFQEPFVVFARALRPVFFGAQDGTGTDLFFLICCPDHTQHLHVLSRLCLLAHGSGLLEQLREVPDAQAVCDLFRTAENQFLGTLT